MLRLVWSRNRSCAVASPPVRTRSLAKISLPAASARGAAPMKPWTSFLVAEATPILSAIASCGTSITDAATRMALVRRSIVSTPPLRPLGVAIATIASRPRATERKASSDRRRFVPLNVARAKSQITMLANTVICLPHDTEHREQRIDRYQGNLLHGDGDGGSLMGSRHGFATGPLTTKRAL